MGNGGSDSVVVSKSLALIALGNFKGDLLCPGLDEVDVVIRV